MSIRRLHTLIAIMANTLLTTAALYAQTPAGTAFTYQGQLKQAGTPFTGPADFEFSLWNHPDSSDPSALVAGPLADCADLAGSQPGECGAECFGAQVGELCFDRFVESADQPSRE